MNFQQTIESRRSVHQYSDEPLDDETLENIVSLATEAPSSYNLQPWEFLVVRDDDRLEQMRECAYDQEHVTDAAATVAILGNKDPSAHAERVFADFLDKGYIPDEETKANLVETAEGMAEQSEEERVRWTTNSTALAAMTLQYAAWDEGVASCPMGGFDNEAVHETFDIPDDYEVVMLVSLGYPEDDAADLEKPQKFRRPTEEVLHFESFDPESGSVSESATADGIAADDD
ncbi:nitroreductase family protein [Haloarchaeobius sp. DFWS5]|uniref:nitroreductase family protein n=1 Tax=Haloarchaeobius sp. DFWS5 TaxID=3446114 RepID=UPI003EB9FA89